MSEEMTRKEVIWQLKGLLLGELRTTTKERKALDYAISSLETEEAYQLEYESTTKNDLGVDAISRDEVCRYVAEFVNHEFSTREEEELIDNIITGIEHMPPATPQEPRKGHWIETAEEYYKAINEKGGGVNENTDYFVDDIACSECLAKFSVIDNEAERFDFCPCCGSDNR